MDEPKYEPFLTINGRTILKTPIPLFFFAVIAILCLIAVFH